MVNRLLIGAAIGALGATAYQKVKSAPGKSAEQKVTNLADKANSKVDEAQRVVDEKVDVVEKAVGEGVDFLADAAHKLIGSGQEKATGVSARAKQLATDYAKQAAKDQLAKQATRLFERVSTEVKSATEQARQAAQNAATKPAAPAEPTKAPTATAETPAEPETVAEPVVPAMVRLEAERYARGEEGILSVSVDDITKTVVFFVANVRVLVPTELLGYEVHAFDISHRP